MYPGKLETPYPYTRSGRPRWDADTPWPDPFVAVAAMAAVTERLRFITRLKALGLSLAEVKELNAVHAIAGSTQAMLEHLDGLLERRLAELDGRIGELMELRDDIGKYRDHVSSRSQAPLLPRGGRES